MTAIDLTRVRSLAWRSDLALLSFEDEVVQGPGYVVARSASNPGYWWGNFVLFERAPRSVEDARWMREVFAREVGVDTRVRHVALGWDEPEPGAIHELERMGMSRDEGIVLVARDAHAPPRPRHDLVVRRLEGDADWRDALECQLATRGAEGGERYEAFKTAQMGRYRRMCERGLGAWWGAFEEGRLVGDLGLFMQGRTGRFQSVGTRPEARQRGVCGTLVWKVSAAALASGMERLVMVADPEYHAARVYESVGFVRDERERTYAVSMA